MCDRCGKEHEIPEDVQKAYEEIIEGVKALTPELRGLLIEQTITKVKEMIEVSVGEEDLVKSKALMAVADNALNLAGLANAHNRDDMEDVWTSTGDKRVDDLWDKHVKTITRMLGYATHTAAVSTEGLPDDTVERLAEGNETEEDMALVKTLMRGTGVEVPDDAELEIHGVQTAKEKVAEKGVGLYL